MGIIVRIEVIHGTPKSLNVGGGKLSGFCFSPTEIMLGTALNFILWKVKKEKNKTNSQHSRVCTFGPGLLVVLQMDLSCHFVANHPKHH